MDEPDEAALLRERLGWQGAFTILSLRSWEPVYGVDVVLRGFARAAKADPRLRLFLLGGGSLAGQIQGLLQQEGLHERVRLGGQVSQAALPGYYRAADLYVSASHSDGSSVSLLEALASGVPALVSDIPAIRSGSSQARRAGSSLTAMPQRWPPGCCAPPASPKPWRRCASQRARWPNGAPIGAKIKSCLLDAYHLARDVHPLGGAR